MREPGPVADLPLAPTERRFNALLVDRLLVWGLLGVTGYVAWRAWWSDGRIWPGVGLAAAVVVVLTVVGGVVLGATGSSPGRALTGLRVVDAGTGGPLGVRRGLLRTTVLGLAGLPTGGLGLIVLAWTAIEDPSGRRRGWHDRLTGSLAIDRRRPTAVLPEEPEEQPEPRPLVNLTALRLAPVEPAAAPAVHPAPAPRPTVDSDGPRPSAPGTVVTGGHNDVATRWRLTADTGETVVVEGLVLFGRSPEGREGEVVQERVALASHDMSISKTHLQVHVARDGTPVVIDRGSTNGSFLLRQGVSRDLNAGRPVTLLPGDRIRFGDRELRVTREE